MEDISRELEREIALSKPKPFKQDRKTRVLIIDDFGKIKPGNHLKRNVKILSFISIVCFAAAGVLFYLYTGVSRNIDARMDRIVIAEKKVEDLTKEKELLMARLVILGKEPGIKKTTEKVDVPTISEIEEKKSIVSKKLMVKPTLPQPEEGIADISKEVEQKDTLIPEIKTPEKLPESPAEPEKISELKKTISIERFAVTKDGANGNLLVRFDIRNISTEPGDVSGRIFTVLKPDNSLEGQWLVVPTAPLKNGIPSEHRKGQYFAISHFKPVKFRIKNEADPDLYKKASIFIFNTQGELIFEDLIDITEAE